MTMEMPVEKKNNKTWAIVGTVAAVLLCGCPGLLACVFGALIAFGVPFTTTTNGYSSTQPLPVYYGIGLLCLAVIFVAIPVVVGVLTLRKKKEAPEGAPMDVDVPQEPLPPAS
ncbi:MAG: hypothetical protein ABIF04_07900 [Chloroflexota bacterium]